MQATRKVENKSSGAGGVLVISGVKASSKSKACVMKIV